MILNSLCFRGKSDNTSTKVNGLIENVNKAVLCQIPTSTLCVCHIPEFEILYWLNVYNLLIFVEIS